MPRNIGLATVIPAGVAAGLRPAVEPVLSARRNNRALAGDAGILSASQKSVRGVPGGRMHALYVRRDARCYGPGAIAPDWLPASFRRISE